MTIDTHANGWPKDIQGGFPRVAPPTNWEANHMSLQRHYEAQRLAAMPHQAYNSHDDSPSSLQGLHDRIGPLHVRRNHWQGSINTHMPLAAGEVAELRPKLTVRYVLGVLVDLGATLGFLAFVAFLLSRAGA